MAGHRSLLARSSGRAARRHGVEAGDVVLRLETLERRHLVQHASIGLKQRDAKRHCGGGSIGLGMSPLRMIRSRRSSVIDGIADRSARVYGWRGRSKMSSAGASSTSLPEVHHRDPVGEVPDDGEVVRDEEVGEAELLLQVGRQVEHLRPHRDVERRDGLVEHEDCGSTASARAMPTRWR